MDDERDAIETEGGFSGSSDVEYNNRRQVLLSQSSSPRHTSRRRQSSYSPAGSVDVNLTWTGNDNKKDIEPSNLKLGSDLKRAGSVESLKSSLSLGKQSTGGSPHANNSKSRMKVARLLLILWLYSSSAIGTFVILGSMVDSVDLGIPFLNQTSSDCSKCSLERQGRFDSLSNEDSAVDSTEYRRTDVSDADRQEWTKKVREDVYARRHNWSRTVDLLRSAWAGINNSNSSDRADFDVSAVKNQKTVKKKTGELVASGNDGPVSFMTFENTEILGGDLIWTSVAEEDNAVTKCASMCANYDGTGGPCMAWSLNIETGSPYAWRCYLKTANFTDGMRGHHERLSGVRKSLITARDDGKKYLKVGLISEQRNSRLVAFDHIVQMAKYSGRILVEPEDLSQEYDFSEVRKMGVETVSEDVFAREIEWQLDTVCIGFHNCEKSAEYGASACLPCTVESLTQFVHSIDEYFAQDGGKVGEVLQGDVPVVDVVLYKRCGRRDDKAFEESLKLFWDYKPDQHLKAKAFLATHRISPSVDVTPDEAIGVSSQTGMYISTHIRTEKWGGVAQVFGENCTYEFESSLLSVVKGIVDEKPHLKTLFLATDAMPGGTMTSATYTENAVPTLVERRRMFESMISRLIHKVRNLGLNVLTYPQDAPYNERAIMDQLLSARSEIFIGTCGLWTEHLTGSVECRKPRNFCGNYGDWIFHYRAKNNLTTMRV